MSVETITIGNDEHVFIAGKTGSGKSVLAEVYLAGRENVIKLDTKGEVYERRKNGKSIWRGLTEGKDFTVVEHLQDVEYTNTKKIIYAPTFEEQTPEFYNALCKYVYERENTILWIDELLQVCENPLRYPPYLMALMTRGRSKNATVWSLTQRPSGIPVIIPSSSTHFFIFTLNMEQDRKKMYTITGMSEMLTKPEKYAFWYYRDGDDICTQARLKL
jgi:ABC-type dipeptide/oligopeptide/nickel transport system ATPase component